MNEFLAKKSLQTYYAGAILLLLLCTAPILSGPRGFGLSMYGILSFGTSSLVGFYMWVNIIVSALFTLLAVPVVFDKTNEKTKGLIRLIGSAVQTFFMVVTLLDLRHLAWGWGLWLIALLTILLFVNVMLNRKETPQAA